MAYRIKGDVEVARDLHVSGNLTVDGTFPTGSGGGGSTSLQTAYDIDNTLVVTTSLGNALIVSGTSTANGQPLMEMIDDSAFSQKVALRITDAVNNGQMRFLQGFRENGTEMIRIARVGNFDSQFLARSEGSFGISFGWLNNSSAGIGLSSDVMRFQNNTNGFDFVGTSGVTLMTLTPGASFPASTISTQVKFVQGSNMQVSGTLGVTNTLRARGGFAVDPGAAINATTYGSDAIMVVSGVVGGKDSTADSTALFLGDVHVSGNLSVDGTAPGGGTPVTTASSNLLQFGITDYATTTATSSNPESVGQIHFDGSEYTGTKQLSVILAATTSSVTASVRLLNLDDLALVEIGGAGITSLESVGVNPTRVSSVDLANAANFNALSASNYELQLWTSSGSFSATVGGAVFEVTGTVVRTTQDLADPASGSFLAFGIADYASTTATSSNPETVGQLIFDPTEYTGPITLRSVLATSSGSVTSSMRLFNVTSGSLVHIGGAGVTELETTNTTPTIVESVNLRSATNFFPSQKAIYELQLFTTTGSLPGFVGSAEFRVTGSVTSPPTRQNLGSYTVLTATASNPQAVGGGYFVPSEHNTNTCVFRPIVATTTGSNTAVVQLFNITSGALVHIGGAGITELTSSNTSPTNLESVNLFTATNFNSSSASIYEVRVYGSGAAAPITTFMNSELVCS